MNQLILVMRNIKFAILLLISSFTFSESVAGKIDTTSIKSSLDDAVSLFSINEDSAISELQKIEKECKKAGYKKGLAECYSQMGKLYKEIGNFPMTLETMNKSLNLYLELQNKEGIANQKLSIGAVYVHLSAYSRAKEYIHQSLEYYEGTEEHFALGGAYMTMSGLYIYLKEYEIVKQYIDKAIHHFEKIGYELGICGCMLNKAIILYDQNKYKECLSEFEKVLELAHKINSDYFKADAWTYMGSSHIYLGNLERAEEYLQKVINLKGVNSQLLIEAYFYLGDLYQAKGNYKKAIIYAQKVIDESKNLNLLGNEQMAYDRLALYYAELGDYKKALKTKEISYNLRDSVFSTEKTKEIHRLEVIYQAEKKQQQIENLENENQIQKLKIQQTKYTYVGIISVLILVLGGIILFIRNGRLKVKNENIVLEQKLLRTQMNPHFIFNAISAIQHYMVTNKSLEASSYLSSFAKLMRSILNNSKEELVTLETERQTLEDYLTLQSLRLDGNIVYTIEGISEIDSDELAIPPMLLQPFIENAIEHGILKKIDQKGKININFTEKQNKLHVEITDDGIGRGDADKMKDTEHKSFATEITNSRIKSMKQSYKKNIFFDIIDLKNSDNSPIGTKVIFELPLVYI